MIPFTFRLERVLRWRVTSLKLEEAKVEQLRFSMEQARTANGKLSEALSQTKQSTGVQMQLTGADLQAIDSYATRLVREIAQAGQTILALSEAIAKQMLIVSARDREVRLLERLRERRREEWQTEVNRESDEQSGDFSAGQWLRAKRDSERAVEPE